MQAISTTQLAARRADKVVKNNSVNVVDFMRRKWAELVIFYEYQQLVTLARSRGMVCRPTSCSHFRFCGGCSRLTWVKAPTNYLPVGEEKPSTCELVQRIKRYMRYKFYMF